MAEVRFRSGQAAAEIMAVDDPAEVFADMFAFRHHGTDKAVQTGDADTAFSRVSVVVIVADVIEIISVVEDADPDQFGIIFRVHGWPVLSIVCSLQLLRDDTEIVSLSKQFKA